MRKPFRMKQHIIFVLLVILSSCTTAPIVKSVKTGHEGEAFPKLNILMPGKNEYFNTANLPLNKTNVFFYFSPTCPHCRVQMRTIVDNMDKLKDVQFTILTIANVAFTEPFIDRYHLRDYSNVVVGIDTGFIFPKYFGSSVVPFTAIYNPGGHLNLAFAGSIGIQQLKALTQHKSFAQTIR